MSGRNGWEFFRIPGIEYLAPPPLGFHSNVVRWLHINPTCIHLIKCRKFHPRPSKEEISFSNFRFSSSLSLQVNTPGICIFSSERKPVPQLTLCCICLEKVNITGISVLHEGFRHAETVWTQQVETWPSVHFRISAVNKLQDTDLFWKLIRISKIIITCYPYKLLHMPTKPYQTWAAVLLWPSSSCVLLWCFWSLTTQVFFFDKQQKQTERATVKTLPWSLVGQLMLHHLPTIATVVWQHQKVSSWMILDHQSDVGLPEDNETPCCTLLKLINRSSTETDCSEFIRRPSFQVQVFFKSCTVTYPHKLGASIRFTDSIKSSSVSMMNVNYY